MTVRQRERRWIPAESGAVVAATTSWSTAGNTWAEAISSTTGAIYIIGLQCGNSTPPVTLDIGTGASSSETVASSYVVGGYAGGWVSLSIPVRIPASTRVSLRHTGTTTGDGLLYVPESKISVRPYQVPGASATVVDYANSSGTSWVEAIASTAAAAYLVTVYAYSNVGTAGVVEVGTGAAAAEVSVAQAPMAYVSGGPNQYVNVALPAPIRIPASTRVAIKAPSSNYTVGFALVYESAIVWR